MTQQSHGKSEQARQCCAHYSPIRMSCTLSITTQMHIHQGKSLCCTPLADALVARQALDVCEGIVRERRQGRLDGAALDVVGLEEGRKHGEARLQARAAVA